MSIRETLRRKNQDLKWDLEKVIGVVSEAHIVEDLEPYRAALLTRARELMNVATQNLAWLGDGGDMLLPDVLSETSILLQYVRLIKVRYLRGLHRTTNWDRVCLQTISWLHRRHDETKTYPAVFTDDDVSTIPSKRLPFYFFPCLEQRGLRFQPLFFHEFGHVLYNCHQQEMDALVGDFQRAVEAELLPASQRNDQYAQEQARLRQSIVETWYKWIQEFFCDAVGLSIGGPCFLYAFSEYVGKLQPTDYLRQASDLHGSSHPISWLRIRLLAERAERAGFGVCADTVLRNWREVASLLSISHDYHGFYTDSMKTFLVQTVDDMMVEAAPCQCDPSEAEGIGWENTPVNLVALLNRAWANYLDHPTDFHSWETDVLKRAYGL